MRELLPTSLGRGPWTPPCTPKYGGRRGTSLPSATIIDLYLIDRKANSYAAKTRQKYRGGLDDLLAYARADHPEPELRGLTWPDDLLKFEPLHIQAWVGNLHDRPQKNNPAKKLSPSTQWTYWMCAKMFYEWAVGQRYIKRSPCKGIRGPKQADRVIVPLTQDHIEAMLHLCPPNTWWGARNRAIIALLLTTGIRRGELVGMDVSDLDWSSEILKVEGKGDQTFVCKERTLAILPEVVSPLLGWIRYRNQICQEYHVETPALFLGYHSHQWHRMTGNSVQHMMHRLGKTAGIQDIRTSAHTVRHTFSATCARNKMMKRSLQDLLGHRSPRSTEIYTRFSDHEMVLDEIRQDNPFKNWKRLG